MSFDSQNKNKPRKGKKPNPQRLAAIALHYLERFAASEASLRRVLENRIRRACFQDPDFAQDLALQQKLKEAIETIVATHKKTGVINDETYAAMKVHSLRRAGTSSAKIQEKLRTKGIESPTIKQAIISHAQDALDLGGDEDEDEAEAPRMAEDKAAQAFAKKRGFGPFRRPEKRAATEPERRKQDQKECQAMARAGFSFDVIRRILKAPLDDEPDLW